MFYTDLMGKLLICNSLLINIFPKGTTHVLIRAGHCVTDLRSDAFTPVSDMVLLPISSDSQTISLNLGSNKKAKGLHVFVLTVEFLQEVNGKQVPLLDKGFNAGMVLCGEMR